MTVPINEGRVEGTLTPFPSHKLEEGFLVYI